jgi:hypothetical protein
MMFRERSAPAKEVEEVARSAMPFRSAGASPREMQHPVALMSPCAWPEARVFGAGRAPVQAEGAPAPIELAKPRAESATTPFR